MDTILVVGYCFVFILILCLLFALYKTFLVYRKYKFLIDRLNSAIDGRWYKGCTPASESEDNSMFGLFAYHE